METEFTIQHLEDYLNEKALNPKYATETEIHCLCPFHGEEQGKRGRLYINTELPNYPFTCHRCGERGNIHTLRKHFSDPPLSKGEVKDDHLEIWFEAVAYCHRQLLDNEEKLEYLIEKRGLVYETIEHFQLGYDDGSLPAHLMKTFKRDDIVSTGILTKYGTDFFQDSITIPYLVQGSPVYMRGRKFSGAAKYVTPFGAKARLYNADAVWGARDVVLCEGEFDTMMLHQLGYAACGVAGAKSWKSNWVDYFEKTNRVFIMFDPDDAGRLGAEKLAAEINGKSRIVNLPEDSGDITDLVLAGETKEFFDSLIASVRSSYLLFANDAYEEWLQYEGNPNFSGLHFGWQELDHWIDPGLAPGAVAVLLAATNAGKTIFLLNVMQNIRVMYPDKHILFISLEQTRSEWFDRARKIHRFYTGELNPDKNNRDTLRFWRDNFAIVDRNRLTADDLIQCLEEYEEARGVAPDVVCVDYLGYFARSFHSDSTYQRTGDAVMKLKEIAKDRRNIIISPHQVSRGAKQGEVVSLDDARDSGVVGETADFALTMWNPDAAKANQQKGATGGKLIYKDHNSIRSFSLVKSRRGPTGAQFDLHFNTNSLTLLDEKHLLYQRLAKENKEKSRSKDYESCFQSALGGVP